MPGMDGVETLARLQQETLAKVPAVIMVTAYGREEAMARAQQQGVAIGPVLAKPITPSTLLEAIGEATGGRVEVSTRTEERVHEHDDAMQSLKGARVLLVEDNEMNQELALEILRQAGLDVMLAGDGQQAVDTLLRDRDFDGVLMDCQMPVMDGYTATRTLRARPEFAGLPILAMTANAMAGDREKVLEAGMNDHIAKPLNVTDMFRTMARWIQRAAWRTPDAAPLAPEETPAAESVDPPADVSSAGALPGDPLGSSGAGLPAGLPDPPGIDVSAGLATSMNNQALYLRMLGRFRDTLGDFESLFQKARSDAASGDEAAMARCAHSLKGAAGNIGAGKLASLAGDLEERCRNGDDEARIAEALSGVLEELATVIAGIATLDPSAETPEGVALLPAAAAAGMTPVAVDAPVVLGESIASAAAAESEESARADTFDPEIFEMLDRLQQLLEDSDTEAVEILSDITAKAGNGSSLARRLRPVAVALDNYDLDAALEKLLAIRATL